MIKVKNKKDKKNINAKTKKKQKQNVKKNQKKKREETNQLLRQKIVISLL